MKQCHTCKKDKPLSDFSPSRKKKRDWCCRGCVAQYHKNWHVRNREKGNIIRKRYERKHPKRILLYLAKKRAKKQNIPFCLTEYDFEIPEHCPVLGLKLKPGSKKPHYASPSLDRIIPNLGYIPGNVAVISWRANRVKTDGTLDDFEKLVIFLRKHLTNEA